METFENYLMESELSLSTIKKYVHDVKKFTDWIKMHGEEIERKSACEWKNSLLSQNNAPSTINAALAAFNKYMDFLNIPECKLKYVKIQKRIFAEDKKLLTRKEYKKLVEYAKKNDKKRISLIMQTIAGTGMRVSELEYITVESINTGCVQIRMKGKIRTILIPQKLCNELKKYVKSQNLEAGSVFITRNGKAIGRKQIWSEMKKLCEGAGVTEAKVFPHNLRHLFARMYYEISKDVVELADILGHSNIETTRIYLRNSSIEHRRKLEKLILI